MPVNAADPFPPTPKSEHTDPRIVIENLSKQATKAVKGNKINLGIILSAVALTGAFAAYMLGATKAQAQTEVRPVQVQVEALDAALTAHVRVNETLHTDISDTLKEHGATLTDMKVQQARMEIILEGIGEKLKVYIPPPTDAGRP
jgi:hypothetical protein